MAYKKLYRSKDNRAVAGIIAGLGEYFNIDPTLLRLAWLIFFFGTGIIPGVLVYIVALFIVPEAHGAQ